MPRHRTPGHDRANKPPTANKIEMLHTYPLSRKGEGHRVISNRVAQGHVTQGNQPHARRGRYQPFGVAHIAIRGTESGPHRMQSTDETVKFINAGRKCMILIESALCFDDISLDE